MVRFSEKTHSQALRLARNIDYRLDAGYTIGAVMDRLTVMKRRFVGRLSRNAVLQRLTEPHLTRPPGHPPAGGYGTLIELGDYKAKDWQSSQRLILVVVDHPHPETGQLELFPRYFFSSPTGLNSVARQKNC